MKIVFLSLVLLLLPATARAVYIDCGGGWQWLPMNAGNAFREQGDQALTATCFWQSPLHPQQRRWLPALPDVFYEQGLPTTLSRSEGYLRYRKGSLRLPVYRLQQAVLGLRAEYRYLQQSLQLDKAISMADSPLTAGQTVVADSERRQIAAELDLRALNTPFTSVWLGYREQFAPLLVSIHGEDELARAKLTSWLLGVERSVSGRGLQPVGHLLIGQGQALNDGTTPALNRAGGNNDFIQLELHAGLYWRYPAGRYLHYFVSAGATFSRLQFNGSHDGDTVRADSSSQLEYGLRSGLSWRF
ncbi:MAG: hypothetical protein KYX62_18025 [Pseudomonadota bacterium]|nr:hypothetical protein [Pseudomonadota bacterium]